jgi:selenocysteine lyase/cysteine desulfurase
VQGRPSEDIARGLVRHGVYASHGDFYATTLVEKLGHAEDGLVRAGAACYTTEDEVDRLVYGVRGIVRG